MYFGMRIKRSYMYSYYEVEIIKFIIKIYLSINVKLSYRCFYKIFC